MTNDKEKINLYKIIKILSQSMDLISETIVGHHQKVAYISLRLGESLNLTDKEIQKLVLTALVHDLGVFYLNQQFSDLGFETKDNKHALVGYLLSKNLFPLKEIPEYIKYHHHEWEKNKSMSQQKPPVYSHILFLADRISVLIEDDINILNNTKKIKNNIKKYSNKRFWPRGVDEFLEISEDMHKTFYKIEEMVENTEDFSKSEKINMIDEIIHTYHYSGGVFNIPKLRKNFKSYYGRYL